MKLHQFYSEYFLKDDTTEAWKTFIKLREFYSACSSKNNIIQINFLDRLKQDSWAIKLSVT